jgi:hypothetical protein
MNVSDKTYWDNKWKQSPVVYESRHFHGLKKFAVDVRNFIFNKEHILEQELKRFIKPKDSLELRAFKITKYVQNTIKYISDTSLGVTEYWQLPIETFHRKMGDCEDMSILIVTLLRIAGCPAHRIKVAAGLVKTGKNAETGGHAYPVFLREDGEWIILDPCYYPNQLPIRERLPFRDESNYLKIWFTFNDEYSWSQKTFKIKDRMKK